MSRSTVTSFLVLVLLIVIIVVPPNFTKLSAQKQEVTLSALLEDQGEPERWKSLILPAIQELRHRHPDLSIQLNYTTYPYDKMREKLLSAAENHTEIDLITLDQIWLGEFAEKGFLTNLTNYTTSWERQNDWYEASWDGGLYNATTYAIWAWTDIRGLWYWKDMLDKAGVDPNSLRTWDGYTESAKKLNAVLRPEGIEGVHLVGASHSPDIAFYPYLWMQGGSILTMKTGHPIEGTYFFPSYNGTEGVRAMEFIKSQIDAGVKPQKNHFWGNEFLDRKFAVMLEALQHHVHLNTSEQKIEFEEKVGFLPMFPVPDLSYNSSSLMGGWEFSIPETSNHKDLAWELITIILEPDIIMPYIVSHANLPTQVSIGEESYVSEGNKTIPYYTQLIDMINIGHGRPNIPEYPEVADHIRQALDEVYSGLKEPKQALDDAAAKSAKALRW
ncbi:MAG TPA: extracellular solute-binding protein [Nitrososphaeraceae archaeon]|nr:extracellular solute-binding protein [Nitrososphaeraceae archaeon]